MFEQFCPKAADANPLVAEPETDFNAKWPFKVIQILVVGSEKHARNATGGIALLSKVISGQPRSLILVPIESAHYTRLNSGEFIFQ